MKEQKERKPSRSQLDIKSYQGSGLNSERSIVNEFHDLVQGIEITLSDGKRNVKRIPGVSSTARKSYFPGPGSASTPERPHPGAKTYAGMKKRIGRGILKKGFAKDFDGTGFEKIYNFSLHRTISGGARGGGRHENALASATMVADMQTQSDVFLIAVEEEPDKEKIHASYQDYIPLIIAWGEGIWLYWRDLNGEMQLDRSENPDLYKKLSFKIQVNNLETALSRTLKTTTILNETYNTLGSEDSKSTPEEQFCYRDIVLFSGEFNLESCQEGRLYFKVSNEEAFVYSTEIKEPVELDSLECEALDKILKSKKIENLSFLEKPIQITELSIEAPFAFLYENACKRKAAEKAAESIYKDLALIRKESAPIASTKFLRVGWSRGGITALHEVNLLHSLGFSGKKLLFLIDPVAGNGVGDVEDIIRRLPPNTKAKIILTKGDRTKEFEPQDRRRIAVGNGAEIEFIVVNGTHSQVAGGALENKENFSCIPADITRYHLHKFLSEELTQDEFKEVIGDGMRDWSISDEKMIEYYAQTEVELDKFRYTLNPLATPIDAVYTSKIRDFAQELHRYVRRPEYFVNDHHEELFKKQYPELYYKYVCIPDEKDTVPAKYEPLASIEELGTQIEPYSKKLLIAGILLRNIDGKIRDLYNKETDYAQDPKKTASRNALRAFKLALMELRESAALSIYNQLDEIAGLEENINANLEILVQDDEVKESVNSSIGEISDLATDVSSSVGNEDASYDGLIFKEDGDEEDKSVQERNQKSKEINLLERLPLVEQCRRAALMTSGVLREELNSEDRRTYINNFSSIIKKPESESMGRKIIKAALQVISICVLGPQALPSTLKYVTNFFKPAVVTQQESVTLAAKKVIKAQIRDSNPVPAKPFYRGLSLGRR